MASIFRAVRHIALASVCAAALAGTARAGSYVGGVYTALGGTAQNALVAYGRHQNGTLSLIGTFPTGGAGAQINGGSPVDPLTSADSIHNVDDRFLLVVNAGSNTVSSFRINPDFSLKLVGSVPSGGFGPDTLDEHNGIVYVANVSTIAGVASPAVQAGNITAFKLNRGTGELTPIANSARNLVGRPSDLHVAPDGRSVVVTIINAGSPLIVNPPAGVDELESFAVTAPGALSASPVSTTTSTQLNNAAGRNLPTGFGFTIRQVYGRQIVVVTEARQFLANGAPGALTQFQTGSVSTWGLDRNGIFSPISLDVLSDNQFTSGTLNTTTSTCWIAFDQAIGNNFTVASISGGQLSTFHFNYDGTIALLNPRAAVGVPFNTNSPNPTAGASGFADITISSDNKFVYELLSDQGAVNVYKRDRGALTLVQTESDALPSGNVQGVAYASPR